MTFLCSYCNKQFKYETSLAKHMCKQKHRFMQRDVQHVKLGFKFFNDWYMQATGAKKLKTYEQFVKSQYYGAFIRFGSYVLDARVYSPDKYLRWLIVNQIRIDSWDKDSVYNKYLLLETRNETPERAVERYILHVNSWSINTGNHFSAYWKMSSTNAILNDIMLGKISPWVLLSHAQAKDVLFAMPDEMLNNISTTIDLKYWNKKIRDNAADVAWIADILK